MHEFMIERRKQKHLGMLFIPLIFLVALFVWASTSYRTPTDYELAQGYTYLLYQIPLLNCVLMPIMLAVIASRLCDMEIKGGTMTLLFTLQKKQNFYDLKFLSEALYLLLFSLGEGAVILLCGKLFHFTEALPALLLCRHMATTFLAGSVVLTLQHILSLLSSNQIVPLLVGLAGSFLGLFSMFFPSNIACFVLWSYFGAFIPFGMNWDRATRIISFYSIPFPTGTFACFTLFGIAFYLLCRYIFMKREV